MIDTTPNSPAGHKLLTQAKRNVKVVDINVEEPITYQGAIYEIQHHQTPRGKSKVEISLYRRKSYQRTYIEYIWYIFYQVRPVVSHLGFCLPEKTITPNNIGEVLKVTQRQFWKEALFVQYDNNKNVSLILAPIPINPSVMEQSSYVQSLLQLLRKDTVLMHANVSTPLCKWDFSYSRYLF